MKITTIELPIYFLDLVIIIDTDWTTAFKKFKLGLEDEYLPAHAVTCVNPVYNQKQEIYVLLKPEYLNYNTITHELYHVISFICMEKGITPDPENDESLAYLMGYIAEHVFEFVDKYKNKPENT